jgi:hypothetical protein
MPLLTDTVILNDRNRARLTAMDDGRVVLLPPEADFSAQCWVVVQASGGVQLRNEGTGKLLAASGVEFNAPVVTESSDRDTANSVWVEVADADSHLMQLQLANAAYGLGASLLRIYPTLLALQPMDRASRWVPTKP